MTVPGGKKFRPAVMKKHKGEGTREFLAVFPRGIMPVAIRVLIVEDEIILAMDMKFFLEDRGYRVEGIAFSGHDAIIQAEEKRPDISLVDIKLQGYMDGIEAAKYLQGNLGIPVIFVTGNTDQSTMDRALAIGPSGYLQKPINENILTDTIEQAIKSGN